jgi:ABC-type multidrug transport system permease subunit
MVMAALGGCWWPGEVMPPWMQTVALALPTAWAMKAFHALISFGYGVSEVLIPSLVLLGFGLLFTWLGSRYLRFEA